MSIEQTMEWTFMSECTVPKDVEGMLVPGEEACAAFRTIRDKAILTSHRLIIRDAEGVTGQKVEMYSLPWKSVISWVSTNSGMIVDYNSELCMWTLLGQVTIKLGRGIDIRRIDSILAQCAL